MLMVALKHTVLLQVGRATLGNPVMLELVSLQLSLPCSCSTFLSLLPAPVRLLLLTAIPLSPLPVSLLSHLHNMSHNESCEACSDHYHMLYVTSV